MRRFVLAGKTLQLCALASLAAVLCFSIRCVLFFFFFQAEDGIRDHCVTGVQTCALPIWRTRLFGRAPPGRTRAPFFPICITNLPSTVYFRIWASPPPPPPSHTLFL